MREMCLTKALECIAIRWVDSYDLPGSNGTNENLGQGPFSKTNAA